MSTPIAVFARQGRPVTTAEVEAALAPVAQQGPDGRGIWCHEQIGLAHLALAETPEMVFACQPAPLDMRLDAAAPRDLVISADVRLDNRAELAAQLDIHAELLPNLDDSQLILAAYLRWGEACAARLLGDFAFMIWDGPRRRLFCARDPFGCKPLFTYVQPDLFLAAGDVRALMGHPQGPRQPDLAALAYYLREAQFNHPTMTYLAGVTSLLPAHMLVVTAEQVVLQRYWFPEQITPRPLKSLDAAVEELRVRLEDAVAARLRRVQGVGAHMSGGLDSTALSHLAVRQLQTSLPTYSWQPAPPDAAALATPEYAPLHTAIAQGDFVHTAVTVTVDDTLAALTRDICRHHAALFVYEPVVRRAAVSANVRVLLSGWGGDEIVSGHGGGYLAEMFWRGRWHHVARTVMSRPVPAGKNVWRARLGMLYHGVVDNTLPTALFDWPRRFSTSNAPKRAPLPSHVVCTQPELASLVAELPPLPGRGRRTSVHTTQLAALNSGHLHRRMEGWAADGADEQIVYRYPLLDRRLVEFALALPPEAYVQGRYGRYLFRRALSDTLPHEVCWGSAKMEPVRVRTLLEQIDQAMLPALDTIAARLASRQVVPRIDIGALRGYLLHKEPNDAIYDVGIVYRAVQVLGAGTQGE